MKTTNNKLQFNNEHVDVARYENLNGKHNENNVKLLLWI